VIMDKISGRSKGFGFVEMPSDAEAKQAIEAINGEATGSRKLKVNQARPREERPQLRSTLTQSNISRCMVWRMCFMPITSKKLSFSD